MNEIGAGVVTDPAHSQIQAGLTQLARIASGQTNVDGTSNDMIAEFCDAGSLFAKSIIGFGATVTREDVKGSSAFQLTAYGIEKIHQLWIHGFDITGTMVP